RARSEGGELAKNSCLAPARTWTMIHFRPLGLVGNCATITQAQRNRRSSLALLVSSRPSHGDSFVGAPASYLLRCRISHPLKASMGVLSATSRVRSADDFPLLPCLIGQTIADRRSEAPSVGPAADQPTRRLGWRIVSRSAWSVA